jgi:hypothetical protein
MIGGCMPPTNQELFDQTNDSLDRIQQFDTAKLPRKVELGEVYCFDDAIEPANKLIDLYKKLSLSALVDFPDANLQTIKESADSDFKLFENVLSFDSATQNKSARDSLVVKIKNKYNDLFNQLHPLISYSMHKATDFEGLEARARATLQQITDRGQQQQNEIEFINNNALATLEQVREIAAEHGVTQQAKYFKDEADNHEAASNKWLKYTVCAGIIVMLYAIAILILSIIAVPAITDNYQLFQFTASKLLVFFVLSFALYFTGRNYFSHKHNAVVNRHRQNALVTYRTIVEAATGSANTDIILNQASTCIFSPQETGFSSHKSSTVNPSSSPLGYLIKGAIGDKG